MYARELRQIWLNLLWTLFTHNFKRSSLCHNFNPLYTLWSTWALPLSLENKHGCCNKTCCCVPKLCFCKPCWHKWFILERHSCGDSGRGCLSLSSVFSIPLSKKVIPSNTPTEHIRMCLFPCYIFNFFYFGVKLILNYFRSAKNIYGMYSFVME